MKVSVIIPVYNRADKVKRAVESVLNQSFPPFEVIVVNDGSTDDTLEVLKRFGNRIKIVSYAENRGVSFARNRGIEVSEGDWIALLDSDDWWFEEKLKKQVFFHERNPSILISQTDEIWIKNGVRIKKAKRFRKKLSGFIFKESLKMCLISPSAVMMHKSLFEEAGMFDENLPACEDYDLWLRITKKYEVGLVDEELIAKTGGHEDQLSFKYWGMDRFRIEAMEKHLDDESVREEVLKELIYKCLIVSNGAKKRGNEEIYRKYLKKLEFFRTFYEKI